IPSEREKMVATIRKVCPSLTLVDQIPSFEEITLPVIFLYKTDAEKLFLSKVAEAIKARGIEVILSDEPIPKARLTVAAKGISHEADINLEEVILYEQDILLKRALWEKLKSSLGISK
ncbi:MAG: hypothetical protein KDK48_04395, partial [Chlamydiia bacterium]|nr:hypothetical protein [Chlamydiia bacterium]